MGAALWVALAPVSLMAVPQVSSAVLVDNLAKVSSERAQVYSSQVREALSAVAPSIAGSSNEGARRLAAGASSGSSLTADQLIVSGPVDGPIATSAVGTNAVAMGVNARASGDYSVAAGSYVSAESGSVALGTGVLATGSESTALGVRSRADSDHGLAVGWRTSVDANGADSLAIGSVTRVNAVGSGGIGKGNVVGGAGSYVIGNGNTAFGADSFVLGSNVTAKGKNNVVLGANSDGSVDNVVSVGNIGAERRIVHVAPGIGAADAVNMSQLKALGATTNTLGTMTNAFVAYDGIDKSVITLGGAAPGTQGATVAPAVKLTNLKAGVLSAQSSDAVNGAQLNATNSDVQGVATSLATLTQAEPLKLSYTDNSKSNVVLGGTGGTIISNLKAGVEDQDAVNVAQLKNAGLINLTGNTLAAITYDSKADGSVNRSSVTLGGAGAAEPVALHNVAAGVVKAGSTDAVNGDQLFQTAQLVDSLQNGAALKYFVSNTTLAAATANGLNATAIGGDAQAIAGNTVALGANSVADRSNSVSVGAAGNERQITNVQAGTADTDAVNVGQLKSAGLVDQTGKAVTALAYDKNASGATDFGNVTLGQGIAGGTAIHNVAAGTFATDAVNLGQLNDLVTHVSNFVTSSSALYSAAGDTSTEAATASGTHAVAMGANATASAANSVALGAGSLADRASSVSVGAVGSERQITNVAAGTSATDAVNGRRQPEPIKTVSQFHAQSGQQLYRSTLQQYRPANS